jgi:hypothetical protein
MAQTFATDNAWLTSLDIAGVVSNWSVSRTAWRLRVCDLVTRNLTRDEWARLIGDPESPTFPYHATCPDLPLPVEKNVATPVGVDAAEEWTVPATPAALGETV